MSDQYHHAKRKGLCFICNDGTPVWDGHSTCERHAKRQATKQQGRVQKARAEGNCTKCFREPHAPDRVWCVGCIDRDARLKNPATRAAALAERPLRQWYGHSNGHRQDSDDGPWLFDVTQKTLFD